MRPTGQLLTFPPRVYRDPTATPSAVHAGLSKTNQVVGVVRKVTIHFVNQVVSAFQCPMKSSDVRRAQSQFA